MQFLDHFGHDFAPAFSCQFALTVSRDPNHSGLVHGIENNGLSAHTPANAPSSSTTSYRSFRSTWFIQSPGIENGCFVGSALPAIRTSPQIVSPLSGLGRLRLAS